MYWTSVHLSTGMFWRLNHASYRVCNCFVLLLISLSNSSLLSKMIPRLFSYTGLYDPLRICTGLCMCLLCLNKACLSLQCQINFSGPQMHYSTHAPSIMECNDIFTTTTTTIQTFYGVKSKIPTSDYL